MTYHRAYLIGLLMPFMLTSCQGIKEARPDAEAQIMQMLNEQQDAWNRGDIPGFMSLYVDNNGLCFVTSDGLLKGHGELEARYAKSYPNAERMGALNFDVLHFELLGQEHAVLIGQWSLVREADRPQGYFTLVWAFTEDGWKIISDHTS
jgi:ketosteroid isomerase-like protein